MKTLDVRFRTDEDVPWHVFVANTPPLVRGVSGRNGQFRVAREYLLLILAASDWTLLKISNFSSLSPYRLLFSF